MDAFRGYCADRVRTYDYDRYFAGLLAPAGPRRGLLALYALNLEVASVRELVSEPALREIRLQWWRDALVAGRGRGTARHAVVAGLAPVLDLLPGADLERFLDARARSPGAAADPAALEAHARETAGALAGLAWRICCAGRPPPPAVGDAGTVWGLAGSLRMAPFRGPAADAGARAGDWAGVAARARALAAGARGGLSALGRRGRPAVGYLPVARQYLGRLGRAGDDVHARGLEPPRSARQLATLLAVAAGRF